MTIPYIVILLNRQKNKHKHKNNFENNFRRNISYILAINKNK